MPDAIPTPLPRIARFERLAYGMFIHWGLYSLLGRGEWVQKLEGIPFAEYARLTGTFTAHDFDARAVARIARQAGMKYITLTTRHHDGFSLYDTRGLDDFDAPHAAAGRDLVGEFVEGCRAEGIVPFFYHTTLDWRWDTVNCSEDKFAEYLEYLNASVEVLCRHYGEIGGLWFDGNCSRDIDWREDRLYATIRRYQPDTMIINNTGMAARGQVGHPEVDSTTFEQNLPQKPDRRGWPKYLAGEMCQTMNSHWGLGSEDFCYLSPEQIIRNLCACRKVGANYLLNVGPTAGGAIPAYEAAALTRVGGWVSKNAEAIYQGRPGELGAATPQDFILEAGDSGEAETLYYFAHNIGRYGDKHVLKPGGYTGPRGIKGLARPVRAAEWLDSGEALEVLQDARSGNAAVNCTGYHYGTDLVVRVAKLTLG